MNSRIALRLRAIILLSALALALVTTGCRAPVQVEGGLQPEAFQYSGATLTKDGGGRLFAVSARGQRPSRFALVEDGGQTHLFWTRQVGERTAQLLPLTRFEIDWYNQAMGQRYIEFFDEIGDIAVSDSLALWRGGSEGVLRWLGPLPEGRSRAVVVSAQAAVNSSSFADYILGTIEVDADGVLENGESFASHQGPYLVIVDGAANDASPRAAALLRASFDIPEGWVLLPDRGSEELQNDAELAQRAGELGVEVIAAHRGDQWILGFAKDAATPGFGPLSQRPAVVESGFLIPANSDAGTRRRAFQVMDALYKGHPLSAAYHLAHLDGWSVAQNPEATLLRHQDLIAAAGFIPWTRAAILEDRDGISPEASVYLSRAFIYQGNGQAVVAHAARAQTLFQSWSPAQSRALGVARALGLESQGRIILGDIPGAESALYWVQENYGQGGDLFRQALAAREQALLNPVEFDFLALSQQFEGAGANYEASRTLLLGAGTYLEREDLGKAQELLEEWRERFASGAPERLELLSGALQLRSQQQRGQGVPQEKLTPLLEQARQNHAWEALLILGLVHPSIRLASGGDEARSVADLLTEARTRSGILLFAGQTEQTLRAICAQLVFSARAGDSTALGRLCGEQSSSIFDSDEGAQSLLAASYRLLQQGSLEEADSLVQALAKSEPADKMIQVRQLLLQAAILNERTSSEEMLYPEQSAALIQQAFDLLQDILAPREAPTVLKEFGDEFALRGFEGHSIAFYQASRQAALNANRTTAEFDATLHLAKALYEAGRWRELVELRNVESPLHGARILLYQGQANFALENYGTARELSAQALGQAQGFGDLQRVSVLHLAAKLAGERGDFEGAKDLIAQAQLVLEALPENRAQREEVQVLQARTLGLSAWESRQRGDFAQARADLQRALTILESVPTTSAPAVRRELLELAAELAENAEEANGYAQNLFALAQLSQSSDPLAAQEALAASTRVLLRLGQPVEAARVVNASAAQGYGLGKTRANHHCLLGSVLLSSGERSRARNHLSKCAASLSSPMAERAQLLLAMEDSRATPSFRAELARHLSTKLTVDGEAERAKITWMADQIRPRKEVDEAQSARLREAFLAGEQVSSAVAYIENLLDTAQFQEADRLLQQKPAAFEVANDSGQFEWIRLRLTSFVRQLRPLDALKLIEEALHEVMPPGVEAEAKLLYLRAAANAQAGQDLLAQDLLEQAKALARAGTPLLKEIESLESALSLGRSGL